MTPVFKRGDRVIIWPGRNFLKQTMLSELCNIIFEVVEEQSEFVRMIGDTYSSGAWEYKNRIFHYDADIHEVILKWISQR